MNSASGHDGDAAAQRSCEDIRRGVRESFEDFAHKRSITDDPNFFNRMANSGPRSAGLLRGFALLSVNNFRVRSKKYLFLSARHDELAAKFDARDAALIGGPKDLLHCVKSGMPFCFSGDLYAAAYNILFGTKFVPTDRVIRRWLTFFSRQLDPCYLVVANDTMPIALLLVKIASQCKNVRVVCVQHGLLSAGPGYDYDDVEGRNSAINLVYSQSQRQEMERRIPHALVEVMGYPGDFPSCDVSVSPSSAVLVGTGTFEDLSNYRRSLDLFAAAAEALGHAGIHVEYRPHPSERGLSLANGLFAINDQTKGALLSGARKIFIGFASTLLYEAHLAGHVVIVLNDVSLPGYSIRDFGEALDTTKLGSLVEKIRASASGSANAAQPGVRVRFEQAIARAMARSG